MHQLCFKMADSLNLLKGIGNFVPVSRLNLVDQVIVSIKCHGVRGLARRHVVCEIKSEKTSFNHPNGYIGTRNNTIF